MNRDIEYNQWRDKANLARAYADREIAFIKRWMREKTDVVMLSETEIIGSDPESLLREAYKTLKKIGADKTLESRDHVLINALEQHALK